VPEFVLVKGKTVFGVSMGLDACLLAKSAGWLLGRPDWSNWKECQDF